ncbi:MAG: phytoene/squalene synthase family protein [Acidobacteria bacterium]|nr:phytoene/squalene synthase family protein [Acidobacteriota bacterium]
MLDRPELERQAARATEAGSKTFFLAAQSFPEPIRRATHAIYWFCRHTDDLVDEAPDPLTARQRLDEWERAFLDGSSGDPILRLLHQVLAERGIPRVLPAELIAGVRMDLDGRSYRTFDELREYCYRVASVPGLMMTRVIGYRDNALRYAEEMGVAMQLTNILRDIGEDLGRGRVYIPSDELAQFGFHGDFPSDAADPRFRELMKFQIQRARRTYAESLPGIALLAPEGRFAVDLAARYYGRILDCIERNNYDVLSRRAVVSRWEKYGLFLRAYFERAA